MKKSKGIKGKVLNFVSGLLPKEIKEYIGQELSHTGDGMYTGFDVGDYNPDELVQKKGLKTFKKMKKDDQVKACIQIKKEARLSTGWEIMAGDKDNEQSVEMANEIKYNLAQIPRTFESRLKDIMSSIEYGFSITEKIFDYWDEGKYKGRIKLKDLKTREPFNYTFKTDEYGNLEGLINSSITSGELGSSKNPYPASKFIVNSYNMEFGNLYGQSDLTSAYRSWWSKSIIMKFWNMFMERHASPLTIARYENVKRAGIDKQVIKEIDSFLRNQQANSGFRLPKSVEVELLESGKDGDIFINTINKHDKMIARAILIPSLLTEQDGSGSYALGKKHFDVFLLTIGSIGLSLEEMIREQIIIPLVKLNYGENVDESLIPRFKFNSLEEEDTEARAKVVVMLKNARLIDSREDWVRSHLQLPERDLEKYPYKHDVGEVEEDEAVPSMPIMEDKEKEFKFQLDKAVKTVLPIDKDNGLSRELNYFEKKVNFVEMDKAIINMEDALKDSLQYVVMKWKADVIKKSEKIIKNNDTKSINKMLLKNVNDFKNVLNEYFAKVHLDTKLTSLEEMQKVGLPVTIKNKFSSYIQSFGFQPYEPIPPKQAVDFFNKKVVCKIEDVDGVKKLLPLGKAGEMAYYSQQAFYVAGVESKYILSKVKGILSNGMLKGLPNGQMIADIDKVFSKYIDSGVIANGKLINPSRLEAIVRTNINTAMNNGRKMMYEDKEVSTFIPYYEWSSILDGRTSEYCNAMDGKVFRKGEFPFPPAHFNCRSLVLAITDMEVDSIKASGGGITLTNPSEISVPRAEGFKHFEVGIPASDNDYIKAISELIDADNIEDKEEDDNYLSCFIIRCPLNNCGTEDIVLIKNDIQLKVQTYMCNSCKEIFKVTDKGKIYLWEKGLETWQKLTRNEI